MKPEIKQKWVAALRSGEYKRTEGDLKNSSGEFCCLGVLCDLYSKETKKGEWQLSPDNSRFNFLGTGAYLPLDVMFWAEMGTDEGKLETSFQEVSGIFRYSLADLNDAGKTFDEIAAVIEEQF